MHERAAIGWTQVARSSLATFGGRAGPVDRRPGHFPLEPPEHSGQAADPQHPQDLRQPAPLDQVAGDLKDVFDGRAVQPLDQQRDEPADRGGLDRRIGVESDSVAVELDEQIDRRLAFLDPMGGILVGGQPLGNGGRLLAKSSSRSIRSCRSQPLSSVTIVSSAVGMIISVSAVSRSDSRIQAPLAMGARTRLPHSVQEPS